MAGTLVKQLQTNFDTIITQVLPFQASNHPKLAFKITMLKTLKTILYHFLLTKVKDSTRKSSPETQEQQKRISLITKPLVVKD